MRARKQGMFRREYEVESDHGPVTTLAGSRREGCAFTLDGVGYRIERDGRKRFLLHGPDGRLATADRDTGREWALKAGSTHLKLVRPSMWRPVWEVRQRGSARGTIRPDGWFSRGYTADVPTDLPLPVRLLALYVALVDYERQASAAAAG